MKRLLILLIFAFTALGADLEIYTTPSGAKTKVTPSGGVSSISNTGVFTLSGVGTVNSVAQSFTGGLISVGGSPITTSGTLALTVAGTSGGIPYFSSASTWGSSGVLALNGLLIGGGAGNPPTSTTTGTGVVTALGINVGSAGAFVTFNGAGGTPSSLTGTNISGTAASLTAGNVTTIPTLSGDVANTGNATTVPHSVSFSVDGAGSAVTTGVSLPTKTWYGGTLIGYTMMCSPSGSVTFNIFRAANNAGLPTISIINNAGGGGGTGTLPAIASGVEGSSSTFTNWGSTTITAKDNLALNLTTVDGVVTKCNLVLYFR